MKYSSTIWVACAFLFLFTACTNRTIEETSTKQEYLGLLDKLSDNARKKQLEMDISYLLDLLSSTQDLKVYNNNVFISKDERSDSLGLAEAFTLPNTDSVQIEFDSLVQNATVEQQYGVPTSTFEIRFDTNIKELKESDFMSQVTKAFVNDQWLEPENIGLQNVDTVCLKTIYTFVTSVDTITITQNVLQDSIIYKNRVVDILEKNDTMIKIISPADLPVVDYRAKTKEGKAMNYQTLSDLSIFTVSIDTKNQIKQLIDILRHASSLEDRSASLEVLNNGISDTQFYYYNMLNSFRRVCNTRKESNGVSYSKIEQIPAHYLQEYMPILVPVSKEVTLSFDKPYEQIKIYVSSKKDTLSSELFFPIEPSPYTLYHVYKDKKNLKYGIVDKKLKIVVPALYDLIKQVDDFYFNMPKLNNGIQKNLSFYIDTVQKELRPLPNDISFVKTLKPGITVFQNIKGKKGVLSNNKLEIVPYRYDSISINGNTIIAIGKQGKQKFYELFSVLGKKISLPQIKEIYNIDDDQANILIRTIDNTYGLINKDATVAIRPQYYGLKSLNKYLLRFTNDPSYDEYSDNDYLWGIVTSNGKIITKPKYYSVGSFSEKMAPFYVKKENMLRGGYIDDKGREVIEPRFLQVNEFYKGYALVRLLENYCLIDKNGDIIKKFPIGTYVELVDYKDQSKGSFYQTTDKIDYDYRGRIIK